MKSSLFVCEKASTIEQIASLLDQELNILISVRKELFAVPQIAIDEGICLIREKVAHVPAHKIIEKDSLSCCVFLKIEWWLFDDIENKKLKNLMLFTAHRKIK
jgi:hypothetical protein